MLFASPENAHVRAVQAHLSALQDGSVLAPHQQATRYHLWCGQARGVTYRTLYCGAACRAPQLMVLFQVCQIESAEEQAAGEQVQN